MRQINRLDRRQNRQVEDWLAANSPAIMKERLSREEIAKKASDQLKFSISSHNIGQAARVLNVVLPVRRGEVMRGVQRDVLITEILLSLYGPNETIPPQLQTLKNWASNIKAKKVTVEKVSE